MRTSAHLVVGAAARFYAPWVVLFALSLFVLRGAGSGVGFIAGLAFALAMIAHALTFGAAASRAAFPPGLARVAMAIGLIAVLLGLSAPGLPFAARIGEGGLFALTAGACALIVHVLIGRAPTLRDEA